MQTSQRRPQSGPSHVAHANLRIFLPEVRPEFRSIPVNARRTVPRVPEGALPVAKVGPRESETSAGHRCGPDLQGIGVLHHRLPKRFVQRSCQKGISRHFGWWRKVSCPERTGKSCFASADQDTGKRISKRIQRVILL